jgi:hypothetical protein
MVIFFTNIRKTNNRLSPQLPYRIDDVLSLNISRFGEFVDRIYPIELDSDYPFWYLQTLFIILSCMVTIFQAYQFNDF